MFLIVALAALLRIVLSPHAGYIPDMGLFQLWAEKGAVSGMSLIYSVGPPGHASDYPPLIPYIYIGSAKAMYALTGTYTHNWVFRILMKIPAIVADLGLVVGSYAVLKPLYGQRRAQMAAATIAFFPATWFLSSIWGQTDSIYVLSLAAAIVALSARRMTIAGFLAGLALMTKFQSLAFLPIFAALVFVEWRRVPAFMLGFAVSVATLLLPFLFTGRVNEVSRAYSHAFGAYPLASIDALGIWNAVFLGTADKVSDTGTVAGISYKMIGLTLFAVSSALLMVWLMQRLRRGGEGTDFRERLEVAMTSAAILSTAFFTLPTQIHERYFFPFIVFALPWALGSRLNGALYLAIGSFFFFDILAVFLAEPHYGYTALGSPMLKTALSIVFLSLVSVVVFRMLKISTGVPATSANAELRAGVQHGV